MSRIEIVKDVCDRCGKELRYPRLKIIPSKNRVQAYARIKTWGDGYPITGVIELCRDCEKEFKEFMKGAVKDE